MVDFMLANWIMVAIALVSGSLLLHSMLQGVTAKGLTPVAAVQLINHEKAVVVDLRDADAFAQGHLVGSRNIPGAELEAKLASVVKNKALPLILVCQTGTRSGRAIELAKKLGYEKAHSLAGGLVGWKSANMPLEKLQS